MIDEKTLILYPANAVLHVDYLRELAEWESHKDLLHLLCGISAVQQQIEKAYNRLGKKLDDQYAVATLLARALYEPRSQLHQFALSVVDAARAEMNQSNKGEP